VHEALLNAERDREVRVVVLTGAGDRAFCADIDISAFKGATNIQRPKPSRIRGKGLLKEET